jgi:uncharacterized protein (TIGR03000 family)
MYGIVLAAALSCGDCPTEHGHHHTHYAYGLCYGACYGVGYGGWFGSHDLCYGTYGGGWGLPYGGYGPGVPGGEIPGYACYGGCGGYNSPAFGVPMAGVQRPGPAGPAGKRDPVSTSGRAQLVFTLPADARLFVDGKPVAAGQGNGAFQTPNLQPGQEYYYEVRAELTRDGKPVSETRRVVVKAGAVVRTDFSGLGGEARSVARGK